MWQQLEITGPHITYLTFALFLITYALLSLPIRNTLHLSEPPLAVLYGILLGPYSLSWITPHKWGFTDETIQEVTRVIVGIQCFAVGIELPNFYFRRHWKSVVWFLGPVMGFSWGITSLFAYLVLGMGGLGIGWRTAMVLGACMSPTDPVLAASVLSNSRFSGRVPRRLRHLLGAESACNDGVSFPFLYIGIMAFKYSTTVEALKEWVLVTVLWQCILGICLGLVIGKVANRVLRFSEGREWISQSSFVVFYLLLAVFSLGVGSMLGSDDFLVAFGAGVGFAHDGWFSKKTRSLPFPAIIDMILNSGLFIFFGSIIPFKEFVDVGVGKLLGFFLLVILFRRIPIVLVLKRFIPDIRTYREALFCGHFGPMGVGALFLVIEARAQLETGTSIPKPSPDIKPGPDLDEKQKATLYIWPIICFVVLGSTMVHGVSTAGISVAGHFSRDVGERSRLLGGETEGLGGMVHEGGGGESEPEVSGEEDER
ncbi:hypothetical protein HYALB_00012947 [Hymenoscyphus albidus]|uniref:Cation/H+ exchanger transmembrane domain-containing protein n=1 Tax=Hymenoscyphus albidus TaxID=595503 RepID=A0A9N9LRU4_9HELO|nr:hypothetical protein HYALB_00012947 [Hymenoscyphus albidus]